ncbi:MAG TPA: NUDIX domain-containing protein [Nanoarchaeota archaeon]|nr:MAG: hypothetical protein QT01_C0006G0015 [archaeon GW2011_AR6]MBS3082821.1 NUDIX domain-containing protein [Candidatus Pacearchaeota archaeon]HIH18002.1 NUDIX domain-containing protein [Nanoarchaeota archaeon]HIH34457.1 NUDIX domain-containing protein [Nanoarchaeota archaeon]HIH50961.1 NUDIX domain-containing protein [Nanoarchaeota archaeon]
MRVAVSSICIREGKILLVKKKQVWILPGGKPEKEESDIDCLLREICVEELPGSQLENFRYYRSIHGVTPHTGDVLEARTYFADISGKLKPSAEIRAAEWCTNPRDYNLSDITRKFVDSLYKCGHLK